MQIVNQERNFIVELVFHLLGIVDVIVSHMSQIFVLRIVIVKIGMRLEE